MEAQYTVISAHFIYLLLYPFSSPVQRLSTHPKDDFWDQKPRESYRIFYIYTNIRVYYTMHSYTYIHTGIHFIHNSEANHTKHEEWFCGGALFPISLLIFWWCADRIHRGRHCCCRHHHHARCTLVHSFTRAAIAFPFVSGRTRATFHRGWEAGRHFGYYRNDRERY